MAKLNKYGKYQLNVAIDPDAYHLLRKLADTQKGFGRLISNLLREYAKKAEATPSMMGMIEDLEARVSNIEDVMAMAEEENGIKA